MPMIDVYAATICSRSHRPRPRAGAHGCAAPRRGCDAPSPLHLDNTAAYVHRLPPMAVHTARTAAARTVRVQVLTPPGA